MTVLLCISILLQLAAAFLASRLIRLTGLRAAWALIATAVALMALRRCVALYHFASADVPHQADLVAESVALGISALLVTGLGGIAPWFQSLQRADRARRESDATLQTVFRAAPIGIGIVTDRVLGWTNDRISRMLGYAPRELQGQSARIVYPSNEEFERVGRVKYGEIRKRGTGTIETRWQGKDGAIIDVLLSSAAIDPADLSAGVVFTAIDITERKRAERERARLWTAIEQAAEAIIISNREGTIRYVNPAFARITGFSPRETVGQNPRLLKSGKHDAAFYRDLWNTIRGGSVWKGRFVNRRKDGSLYQEDATISPVRDAAGVIQGYVAVKRDVTREVELEAQLRHAQQMEAVGQLAGGVAHDFNNLLQAIFGYADFALAGLPPDEKHRKEIAAIRKTAERAADLTRQLLAFGRRQVLEPVPLDLNRTIADVMNMLRRVIGENIELRVVPGRRLRVVHADPAQIQHVLVNLLVNARDAMPDGGRITLETENVALDTDACRTHPWARPGRYVRLSVTDTGCGMDEETLSHIFEPFFTTKELGKGTGLGLATVYGTVKQHGGMIHACSEPERGTTFKVYLPALERKAARVGRRIRGPVPGGTETILFAEDDPQARQVAARFLEEAGYTVLAAADGKEAWDLFEAHAGAIHLALLDVVMPKLGGRALLDRIRARRPEVRFLFCSGYSASAMHTQFVREAGLQLLAKPFDRETLLRRIRAALDAS